MAPNSVLALVPAILPILVTHIQFARVLDLIEDSGD